MFLKNRQKKFVVWCGTGTRPGTGTGTVMVYLIWYGSAMLRYRYVLDATKYYSTPGPGAGTSTSHITLS